MKLDILNPAKKLKASYQRLNIDRAIQIVFETKIYEKVGKINGLVYELYGLTEEEIKVVEGKN